VAFDEFAMDSVLSASNFEAAFRRAGFPDARTEEVERYHHNFVHQRQGVAGTHLRHEEFARILLAHDEKRLNHTHTHTHTHTQTNTNTNTNTHTHTHTHTHSFNHTNTHTHKHTHTHTHTHTQTHSAVVPSAIHKPHALAHTQTHLHMHTGASCSMSASPGRNGCAAQFGAFRTCLREAPLPRGSACGPPTAPRAAWG
jgi:hypothetical protein